MFDARWRDTVERGTAPASAILRRTGITANQLTASGLVLAVVAAIVIATGQLVIGAVLIGVCGLPDLLDGPVAKATDTASVRGAFFDSVADRVTDALLLAGVAWYLAGGGHDRLAVLPLGVLAASSLPSYIRAKAESLGLSAAGGLMERAERLIVLGVGLIVQPFFPLLVPMLWLMLALSLLTAAQRFAKVWSQAPAAARRAAARESRERRTWRVGRSRSRGAAAPSWRWRARRSGDPVERWRARRAERLGASGRHRGGRSAGERRP